ncbi:MAG: AtpZ/AtpI family protein [Prolixibacteraceae bacterium]|nr:AtpZ/AtpI family protein [Prolixibacteraceae bacterium]
MENQFHKNKKKFDTFIRYSGLGFEMMSIIAAGTFAGYKIDQWMNNDFRGFTLGLMILSVIGAVIYSVRNFMKK